MQFHTNYFFSLGLKAIAVTLALCCAAAGARASAEDDPYAPAPNQKQLEAPWKSAETAPQAAAQPEESVAPATLKIDIDEKLVTWKKLNEGLELLELGIKNNSGSLVLTESSGQPAELIILRVNPEYYEFTLHMASEDGQQRSLAEHASLHGLTAAINAGMYLPDNLTNTGYMQSSTHTNNPRIVSRFGVFFVAEPYMDDLPKALLLEKSELGDDPAKFLNYYKIVVQNFRLISAGGEILWPKGQSVHSISALAQNKNGDILLILCRYQLSPADFARMIMTMPLESSSVMYLEGGSPAGLLLNISNGNAPYVWRGRRNSILALEGSPEAPVPNVLGLRLRPKEPAPHDD